MKAYVCRLYLPVAIFCVALFGADCGALAASPLQSIAHPTFGPGTVTRDPLSDLDWLDWSLTTNRAVSEIAGELAPGGQFSGYRYATLDEVIELYQHAGFTTLDTVNLTDYLPAVDFVLLFGLTRTFGTPPFLFQSRAFLGPDSYYIPPEFGDDFPDVSVEVLVQYYRSDGLGFAGANGGLEFPVGIGDGPDPNTGHALVREVPESRTIWLVMAAALALALGDNRGRATKDNSKDNKDSRPLLPPFGQQFQFRHAPASPDFASRKEY